MGQVWSGRNYGFGCLTAVEHVEKLLGPAKTGCIAPPENLAAPIKTAQATGFVIWKQGRPAVRAIIICPFNSYPSEGSLYISAAMLDKPH